MIFEIFFYIVGAAAVLIGSVMIYLEWATIPPTQEEIDRLRKDALETKNPSQQAFKWMIVSDTEIELERSKESKHAGWLFLICGIGLLAGTTWFIHAVNSFASAGK